MHWRIVHRAADGTKHTVETTAWRAQRAALTLDAHELRNGRAATHEVHPPTGLDPAPEHYDLPAWALEALQGSK